MQTFLPYADFRATAAVLDRQRLGKQRVEAWQILRALMATEPTGWVNHPAVKMWRDAETGLAAYAIAICDEWLGRGYRDTMRERFLVLQVSKPTLPKWLGDERLHSSHRAALLLKDSGHYSQFGWSEVPGIDYWWPV